MRGSAWNILFKKQPQTQSAIIFRRHVRDEASEGEFDTSLTKTLPKVHSLQTGQA